MKANHMDKRLLAVILIGGVLLPLVCTAVLGPLRTYFSSDVMMSAEIPLTIGFLYDMLNIAAIYASHACIAYALTKRAAVLPTLLIIGGMVPLIYIVSAIVDVSFFGAAVIDPAYILYCVISCLTELVRLFLAAGLCALILRYDAKRGSECTVELLSLHGTLSKTGVAVTLVAAGFMLISNITETIALFAEFGAPINTSETISLISPYITTVIYAILGYFLVYSILHMLQGGAMKRKDQEI